MSAQEVRRELLLDAPAARVWAAVADPRRLSAWFGARAQLDLRPGGLATFTWPDGTVRNATVEDVQEARVLVLRWHPFERDAAGRARRRPPGSVRLQMVAEGPRTRLIVVETRPGNRPDVFELYGPRHFGSREPGPNWELRFRAEVGS